MSKPQTIEQVFESYLKCMAVSRRPGTIRQYRSTLRHFVRYLSGHYPEVRRLSQLRRDPHILGWLANLCGLRNCTRIHQMLDLRQCFRNLAAEGRYGLKEDLIVRRDFPRPDKYLPRPLSPQDDILVCEQLRKMHRLQSTALLLMRATGMRVGECLNLALDCVRDLGDNQWAIRVPLGKMHTERLVPLDGQARSLVDSLLAFRDRAPASARESSPFLLLNKWGRRPSWETMTRTLRKAAQSAGCSIPRITTHQLRHCFATEMLRGGASLPAVKALLGHAKIDMTLRYIEVSQVDLQREYKQALANLANLYQFPNLNAPRSESVHPYVRARQCLADAAHLLEMHRRNLDNPKQELTLRRLLNRLTKVASALKRLQRPQPTAGKK
jgi:site-specific recombinase XerD